MTTTLDHNRPYGTNHGGSGRITYVQDNLEFDHNGDLIDLQPEPAAEPVPELDIRSPTEKLSIVALKQMMETLGEEYLNKKQAVEFIEAHEASKPKKRKSPRKSV